MGRTAVDTVKHGRSCKCARCVAERRDYMRAYRAGKRGLDLVPDLPVDDQSVSSAGAVAAAVQAELATLSASESRAGLAASAIRMAEIIDSKPLSTTAPSAQRRLQAALAELRAASVTKRGKLASVAAMSQRGPRRDV
jgi:hypothetical protein